MFCSVFVTAGIFRENMSFARCPNRSGSVRSSVSGLSVRRLRGDLRPYDPTTRIVAEVLDLVVKATVR